MRIIIDIVTRNDHGDKTLVSSKKYSGGTYTVDINLASVTRDTDLPAAVAHELARHFADELSWVHPGNPFVKPRRIVPSEPKPMTADMMGNLIPDSTINPAAGVLTDDEAQNLLDRGLTDGLAEVRGHAADVVPINPETREYDVTWRRPFAAYAHDTIVASSLEDAMTQAKARVERPTRARLGDAARRDEPFFEANPDSMDACDWISVEGDNEYDENVHVEWEEPKLSAGALVKALNEIVKRASNPVVPLSILLSDIADIAAKALADAVPTHD